MALLSNEFTCPNKHSFTANAKIRARCPQCGLLARKDFSAKPDNEGETGTHKSISSPVLLRQGKVRMPRKVHKADPSPKPVTRTRAHARVSGSASNGLVKTTRMPKTTMPKVKRQPQHTAIARHISEDRGSYMDRMIRRFGIG
jgi:hypothetical protein